MAICRRSRSTYAFSHDKESGRAVADQFQTFNSLVSLSQNPQTALSADPPPQTGARPNEDMKPNARRDPLTRQSPPTVVDIATVNFSPWSSDTDLKTKLDE